MALTDDLKKDNNEQVDTRQMVSQLFRTDYGTPFMLTDGQKEIFDAIFTRGKSVDKRRIHVMSMTQYGKSDTISMAVLLRASTFPEKWCIVAPSQAKARIIIGYIIKHLFENEYTMSRFKTKEGEKAESIRRERSKNRLMFDVGNNQIGEIFVLSAESKMKNEDVGNAMMGFSCIPEGYTITTDQGDIPIEKIVKEKLPVSVLTYNEDKDDLEYKSILSYQENPIRERYLLEIEVDGQTFQCTDDHPVYVKDRGYIPASELKEGDEVCVLT